MNFDLSALTTSQPRGLHNFISDIRNCKSKEEERARVDKELANIRAKFAASASLSSRDKKKYVWKMCYMFMLGYEIDFGHTEFISLLSSTKFQEKSVGYMAFSLMLRPGDELMTLVVNSMRNDIVGQLHHGKTLALAAVSNIGGTDLAEALSGDVQRILISSLEESPSYTTMGQVGPGGITAEDQLRHKSLLSKKAALCLLRLFRTNPECLVLDEWMKRMARLLEDRDLGVVTSVLSLLLGFASSSPVLFEPLVPYVISILTRLVINRTCPDDYLYYRTPCPWLQVKCLRFLQYYKIPSDATQLDLLSDILNAILVRTEVSESNSKSNGDHSILFEAIALVVSYGAEAPTTLKEQAQNLLGRFIGVNDANLRYLGLDAMTRMAKLDGPACVQMHQATVQDSLKDPDISVRRRSLNLLYVMTDSKNAVEVVQNLLLNLPLAEAQVKEDIVVKIAILAEKFSPGLDWYVDTMIQVILVAGDYVAEAVWYRIVQVVINNPDTHEHAAEKLLASVENKWAHETIVAVAAYLLGEIGVNVCEQAGMSGLDQFNALDQHFNSCSLKVQCILLSCYMKLLNLYPDQIRDQVLETFTKYSTSAQLELQQRACEYLALPSIGSDAMEAVLNPMPPYDLSSSKADDVLLGTTQDAADRSAWSIDAGEKLASREAYIETNRARTGSVSSGVAADVTQAAVTATASAPAVDLLSLDDDDYNQGAGRSSHVAGNTSNAVATGGSDSSMGGVGLSSAVAQQLPQWLNSAALAHRGAGGSSTKAPLLRNEILSVSISAEYRSHAGRLAVFFDNLSDFEMVNLRVTVSATNAAEESSVAHKQQDPPGHVTPGDEGRMQLAVECLKPFSTAFPLAMDVYFQLSTRGTTSGDCTGSSYHYRLQLPVCASCFAEALPLDKDSYMAQWKAADGAGCEAQEVFSLRAGQTLDSARMQYVKGTLAQLMRLAPTNGLDNDRTLTGSSTLVTGTLGTDGKAVSVGVLLRLEADMSNNKFRITVRSKYGAVASSFKSFIVSQLSS